MIRHLIDEYLDGALDAAGRSELERCAAADPAIAQLIAAMKSERALRAAVYASYEPSAQEAQAFAGKVLSQLDAPVGQIGVWMRRLSAIAAVLALVAGSFVMGRMTATPTLVASNPEPQVIYRVLFNDEAGKTDVKEFASLDEANGFMKQMEARHAEPVMVADAPSDFDADQPGSL